MKTCNIEVFNAWVIAIIVMMGSNLFTETQAHDSLNSPLLPRIGLKSEAVVRNDLKVSQSVANTTWTSGPYGNDKVINKVLSIAGASSLTVSISGITETGFDFVYIYDENDVEIKVLDGLINEQFRVNSASITVSLISDFSVTASGISVSISEDSSNNTLNVFDQLKHCIRRFSDYFGNHTGPSYSCFGNYLCQDTSGGRLGQVSKIAIHKQLDKNQFWYFWGGWGNLNLDYCF